MNKPLVIIDVDDIYIYANDEMHIQLTKEEAMDIYNKIDTMQWDCENSTFWSFIASKVNDYMREKDLLQ